MFQLAALYFRKKSNISVKMFHLHVIDCENWKTRVQKENLAQVKFQNEWNSRQNLNNVKEERKESTLRPSTAPVATSTFKSNKGSISTIATSATSVLKKELANEKQKVRQLESYIAHIHAGHLAKK